MDAATPGVVVAGPLPPCRGPHCWAYQYGAAVADGVAGSGASWLERYSCAACLATIDARRPPLLGAAGRYPLERRE